MPFSYKAIASDGHLVTGVSELSTRESLIISLRKQNLKPLTIKSSRKKSGFLSGDISPKKVKSQDLVIFTRQLATMINAGVPLARSLSALQADSESPMLQTVLAGVVKDIEGGMSMGDSLAKYPKVFSDIYVHMVKAGEAGGILDDILKRLASQVELDASIRKRVKSAMMYPSVILTVTVIGFFGIMLFIVPKISVITNEIGGPSAKLPAYTRVLLAISNFCVHNSIIKKSGLYPLLHIIPVFGHLLANLPNLIFLAVLGFIGSVFLLKYIKTPKGRYRFDDFLLRVPVIKLIVSKIAVSRFSRTFASLMGAGVSVLDSLDVTGAALGNKVFQAELKKAALEVKNGHPLSEEITASKHFPPIVSQMLLVGEETGQMDQVLVKIADFYDEEVGVLITGLSSVIEPVMIVLLGAAVGLIAASVMGPIADLSKDVTPTSGFILLIHKNILELSRLWYNPG